MRTSMPLNIIHLTSAHYAVDARILHKECKSLAKAGHEVTVVGMSDEDAVIAGVKIKALRKPTSRWERWTLQLWRVLREATRSNADVYHFHDPELIPVGIWLSLKGKHVVYDAHEDLPRTFSYKS